jgi:hypothetical protein
MIFIVEGSCIASDWLLLARETYHDLWKGESG